MHKSLRYTLVAAATSVLFGDAAQAGNAGFAGAKRHGNLLIGIGMVCNTTTQAEHYVHLRAGGGHVKPAVRQVNRQAHDPQACGLAAIAVQRDRTMAAQPVRGQLLSIVQVKVVGGFDGQHWTRVRPLIQYAIMSLKGETI